MTCKGWRVIKPQQSNEGKLLTGILMKTLVMQVFNETNYLTNWKMVSFVTE